MATPTIRSVAAHAGVSIGTVSNVLNNPAVVRPALRERVQAAIDELGFVPDRRAREFSSGRNRVLGLMFIDLGDPFFPSFTTGFSAVAAERDYMLTLSPPTGDLTEQQRFLATFESYRYAGVVLSPGRSVDHLTDLIARLQARGSVVLRAGNPADVPGTSAVRVDEVHAGAIAAEHLLALGHRDLVVVTAPTAITRSARRLAGFTEAAVGRGARVHEIAADALTFDEGRAALRRARQERPGASALFCVHDVLALGVLYEAGELGLTIPGDLSVLGADDLPGSAMHRPRLTSLASPGVAMGEAAARLLIGKLEDGEPADPVDLLFHAEVVVRESTGPAGTR